MRIRADGGIILSAVQANSFEVVHCFHFACVASRFDVPPKNPPIGQLHFGSAFLILKVLIFAFPCRVFREVHEFPLCITFRIIPWMWFPSPAKRVTVRLYWK